MYADTYKYVEDVFEQQKEIVGNDRSIVVFDVGACVGNVSKHYAELFNDVTVHAFEPYRKSYSKLYETSEVCREIKANQLALSDKIGTAVLNINSFDPTNSLLESHIKASYYWGDELLDTVDKDTVEVSTIDYYCKENNIKNIDILKLDTQGTEYDVLQGAENMLRNHDVLLVYMEIILVETYVGQKKLPEITDFMDKLGYRLFNIYSPLISPNKELNQVDAIFLLNGGIHERWNKT